MSASSRDRLSVTMVAPTRVQCGVADYTRYLAVPLGRLVDLPPILDPASVRLPGNTDLVHFQHQYFLYGGLAPWKNRFASVLRGAHSPVVLTAHEFVEPSGPAHVRAAIRLTNRAQFSSKKIARLIVHTETDRRRMTGSGIDNIRIVVIRHAVPPAPVLPPREEAKRALGLSGRFVITLFGFLSRRKGHGIAIEAMSGLPPEAMLLLAGGRHPDDRSNYARLLETQIVSAGVADRARITGYLAEEDVARVMAATDLVVAPFLESSGSGSLALAFACGKAIGASGILPHREFVAQSEPALRVVDNCPDAWREFIAEMMSNADERSKLEACAVEYAALNTYERMAIETVRIYRDSLSGVVA